MTLTTKNNVDYEKQIQELSKKEHEERNKLRSGKKGLQV